MNEIPHYNDNERFKEEIDDTIDSINLLDTGEIKSLITLYTIKDRLTGRVNLGILTKDQCMALIKALNEIQKTVIDAIYKDKEWGS